MKMRMESPIVSEGVDDQYHPQYSVIKAQHRSKEDLQALFGTVAEFRQQLAVVLESDPEQNGDAEHKLTVGCRVENIIGDIFTKLDHFLGMAARAKPAALAGERQNVLIFALRVGTAHPGKSASFVREGAERAGLGRDRAKSARVNRCFRAPLSWGSPKVRVV